MGKTVHQTNEIAIGIDFGAKYSRLAVFQNGKVEPIDTIPSYVVFTDTAILVGDAAKNQMELNPANTVFGVNFLIGLKFDDPHLKTCKNKKHWPFKVVRGEGDRTLIQVVLNNEEKTFSLEEISAMVLIKLKEKAEEFLEQSVRNAVITVSSFNDSQRQVIKDASTIAGLNVLRIISEPSAAALAYGLDKKGQDKPNVLIFDFGGIKLDVGILTIADGFFELKAVAGDWAARTLPNDWYVYGIDYFVWAFKRKYNEDLTNPSALHHLYTACELAKCKLSSSNRASIEIDSLFDGINFTISAKITRTRFEELCDNLFRSTLNPVEKTLRDAKMDKSEINEIILVGGSSRIPMVQKLLSDFFNGKQPNQSINPDKAAAYGAAIQAAILSEDKSENIQQLKDKLSRSWSG